MMKKNTLGILCITLLLGLHLFLWWKVDRYKYSAALLPARILDLFPARHVEAIPDAVASATFWIGFLVWAIIGAAITYVLVKRK